MNRKQLLILLALVVIAGIVGWFLRQHGQSALQPTATNLGQKLLGTNFPINDITHIALKQGAAELNLVKKDGRWRVRERNDYPANYSQLSDFLIKAADAKVIQSETVGPSQLARLELAPAAGTNSPFVVELKGQGDKPVTTLLLGKKHLRKSNRPSQSPFGDMEDPGWPDGRWVALGTQSSTVALISEPFATLEPKADQWLDKDFFKIDKLRSISVTYTNSTNSWKLTRDTESAEWKLADAKPAEQLDATKASGLANPLLSPTFTDVDIAAKPAALGLDKPTTVNLDTFDNVAYTLKIGQKTNDNYPVTFAVTAQLPKQRAPGKDEKPEDKTRLDKEFKDNQKKLEDKLAQEKAFENWTFLVSSWTFEPLLKERAQLFVEKKEEPAGAASTNAVPVVPAPVMPDTNTPPPPANTPAAPPNPPPSATNGVAPATNTPAQK
jgi:hypothetical protein